MISLVATDLDSDRSQGLDVPWRNGGVEDEHEGNKEHVPATLIVIPAPRYVVYLDPIYFLCCVSR